MAEIKTKTAEGGKLKDIFSSLIFYISILFFFISFQFSDTMVNGWYQQFMPNLGNRQIKDITFLDSLNGYAVASQTSDSSFILRTTNGGDNWQIIYGQNPYMTQLQFLNLNTGYTCGSYIYKTTNGGFNWSQLNMPAVTAEGIYILNQDTIWFVGSNSLVGGVYRTTNGGASWDRQLNLGSLNPEHVYMYNGRIGFISRDGGTRYLRKTTNSGLNWDTVDNNDYFIDIYFVDSLIGWKSSPFGFKKTTNGGFNWVTQTFPLGGMIQGNGISSFSNINRDTIWGNGGYVLYPNNQFRGMLNRTINGGDNWLFQIPDTSIHIGIYDYTNFTNKLNGWATSSTGVGIHTTTGGDTVWYIGIQQIANAVPEKFILKQNYPNPFNPRTVIPYSLSSSAHVKIIAYDILGREVQKMVDNYQQAGAYEVDFMGKFTSTGVYFYRMTVTDDKSRIVYTDTKKMVLLK